MVPSVLQSLTLADMRSFSLSGKLGPPLPRDALTPQWPRSGLINSGGTLTQPFWNPLGL